MAVLFMFVLSRVLLKSFCCIFSMLFLSTFAFSDLLDIVRKRGNVKCGVSQGVTGFSSLDDNSQWSGFDVVMCQAVASALFDDPTKVEYVSLSPKERFTALKSGEVDMLSRNTTWTMSRALLHGQFVGVNFYDGQSFMVRKSIGVNNVKELAGASICVAAGTTTELNVEDYFKSHGLKYELVTFETMDESVKAYDSGRCDSLTSDTSALVSQKLKLKNPNEHVVLSGYISKEPLGPMVAYGNAKWASVVEWSLNAMIIAEELNVSSKNLRQMQTSFNPKIKRLLGINGEFGSMLLNSSNSTYDNKWAYRIIKHVGNYKEVYDQNIGKDSALKIKRGINALWTEGGILYSPPIR